MNRSSLPIGINTLKKWWNSPNEILKCSLPFQRHSGMWNAITKSMFVWSMLSDSYIPPIVLLKDKSGTDPKGKDIFTYQILDGQQRLRVMYLTMCSYYRMKPSEEDKPFAREIPLYLEGSAVDDLVGGAEPISGTAEWAGKSFGESGSVSEASDRSLGDIGFISETAEDASGESDSGTEPAGEDSGESGSETEPSEKDSDESGFETEPAEESIREQSSVVDSEVNQCGSGSDVKSDESTENSDEVPQPCSGVDPDGEQEERGADE